MDGSADTRPARHLAPPLPARDGLAAAVLHTLAGEPPGALVSLPWLGKRLQLGASVVMRELSAMGSARIGGREGPGWVDVAHDGERWMVQLTAIGRGVATRLEQTADVAPHPDTPTALIAPPDGGLTEPVLPPPAQVRPVQRQRRDPDGRLHTQAETDVVASEVPIALVFNGISHAVMMATPSDLEAFALGFALSEGLIASRAECYDIEVTGSPYGCEVQIRVAASAEARLKEQRRNLAGRTGCGLCGIDSLERLDLLPERLRLGAWVQKLQPTTLLRAFAQLPSKQPLNAQTGAHHAAGWVDADGTLQQVMEDVGRHNALDKLLGQRAMNGETFDRGIVVMSSRASHELVRKCARLGVPVLAAISAPTSLAIDVARQAGMQLYGFCRGEQAVRYDGGVGFEAVEPDAAS